VISIGVFNRLTARGDIGSSAALALVLAGLLAIFLLLYFRFFARNVEASL
jgi:multiple sugar transport system permease protein